MLNSPSSKIVTVNSRSYDRKIRRSWDCELMEVSGPLVMLVGRFDREVVHPELGTIKAGSLSHEFFWLDRWYNVFRFHEPDGTFRNYYCNITMPPVFADHVLDYIDLDIDVLAGPDGEYRILDEEELEQNAALFDYPRSLRDSIAAALEELTGLIENRDFPFKVL